MNIKKIIFVGLLSVCNLAIAQIDTRTACDFSDIKDFVEWFKGSKANQKSATNDPLEACLEQYDDKGKKLAMEYELHSHDELGWPILPYLGNDFRETFIEHDKDTVEYNSAGGMGYNHTYLFKREPCWKLVKFTHDRL